MATLDGLKGILGSEKVSSKTREGDLKTVQDNTLSKFEEILNSEDSLTKKIEEIKSLLKDEDRVEKLSYDFFKSIVSDNPMSCFLLGSAKKKEVQTEDVFGLFIKILIENEIIFSDLEIHEEKNNEAPYKLIEIKTQGREKIILLSNDISKSTYIYDGIIDIKKFKGIEKGARVQWINCEEISYGENYENLLKEKIFKENKKGEEEETLSEEDLFESLLNYKGKSIQKSYNHLFLLGLKQIKKFKLIGKNLDELLIISGIIIDGNINTLAGYQEWLNKIFSDYGIKKMEILDKEILKKELINYERRSIQESYDYFMAFDSTDIKEFEMYGRDILKIKIISEIDVPYNIKSLRGFQEWINEIFEKENIVKTDSFINKEKEEKLNPERYIKGIINYKDNAAQYSYDLFMNFNWDDIEFLKIFDVGISKVQKILGLDHFGNIKKAKNFKKFIDEIFKDQNILTYKDQIRNTLINFEGRSPQESYDYFMFINGAMIPFLDFEGKGINSVKSILGFSDNEGDIRKLEVFKKFINIVFKDQDIEFIK